jgi:uncharacterized membrane protein YedE/YeeE
MYNFTPVASLFGGILIGLSASAMLLLTGKITGISGIFAGVLRPANGDTLWKACFLAGLLAGGLVLRLFLPRAFDFGVVRSWDVLALAGLLVGFGTRLGNGCTSGHGVCGVSTQEESTDIPRRGGVLVAKSAEQIDERIWFRTATKKGISNGHQKPKKNRS